MTYIDHSRIIRKKGKRRTEGRKKEGIRRKGRKGNRRKQKGKERKGKEGRKERTKGREENRKYSLFDLLLENEVKHLMFLSSIVLLMRNYLICYIFCQYLLSHLMSNCIYLIDVQESKCLRSLDLYERKDEKLTL